jgi:cation diffusion facilitator CzcD-associated flavoprotein CzcO
MSRPDENSGAAASVDPGPASLAELEARLARDFLCLQQPAKAWVAPRVHPEVGPMLDVAIIGAGMAALSAAAVLMRLGVRNIRLFDRQPDGFEGPWATYARMETLRSPKELSGPSVGLSNLSFRAWFEAQFGAEAWAALGKIPRLQWMDYLRWYRKVLAIPVENGVEMTMLDGTDCGLVLTLRSTAGTRRVAARRVVVATGRDGLGGPFVPPLFRAVDRAFWAHSSDPVDFARLRGKVVGVIGAGASSVDNAASALEAGAARVAMLVRRLDVPRINKGMGVANPGMSYGFYRLAPEERWAMTQYIADCAIPPPRDSMIRAGRHRNFSVLTGCALRAARTEGRRLVLETARGTLGFDFVILATGFTVDWSQRPELGALARHIVLWRDRFVPEGGERHEFADHPWLGPDFEFLERTPGTAPWVSRVHCLNFGATLSHGKITGDIPAISIGAERLAEGIASALFAEDYAEQYRRLVDYQTPELRGDEWRSGDDAAAFAWRPDLAGAET